MPKITNAPPTIAHKLTRNFVIELGDFVIFIVRGENSIYIFIIYWNSLPVSFLF